MQDEQLFGVSHGGVVALSIAVHQEDSAGTWVAIFVHWKNRKPTYIQVNPPADEPVENVLAPWHGLQAGMHKLHGAMSGLRVKRCIQANGERGCEMRITGSRIPS